MSDKLQKEQKEEDAIFPFQGFLLERNILDLRSQKIPGAIVKQFLIPFLQEHPEITTLNLQNNAIDAEGAQALALFLQTNQTIHTLDLSDNKIDDSGAEALVGTLIGNRSIRALNVSNNAVTARWERLLRALTAGNRDSQQSQSAPLTTRNVSQIPTHPFSMLGISAPLIVLLGATDLGALLITNSFNLTTYGDSYYQRLIKEQIGPNLQQLIYKDETARQAYERHKDATLRLGIDTLAKLATGLEKIPKFPHYYPYYIVSDANFLQLIPSIERLFSFTEAYPAYAEQALLYVLASDRVFMGLIASSYNCLLATIANGQPLFFPTTTYEEFCRFTSYFPEYADQAAQRVLASEAIFKNVIRSPSQLFKFCQFFPDYAYNAVECVFTNEEIFSHPSKLSELSKFASFCPGDKKFATQVVKNRETFKQLVNSPSQLFKFCQFFPDYANEAIRYVLADDTIFRQIIRFPEALSIFCRFFPQNAKETMQRVLTNEVLFKNLISSLSELSRLVAIYTDDVNHVNRVIQRVLKDDTMFKYCNEHDKRTIRRIFTNREVEFRNLHPDRRSWQQLALQLIADLENISDEDDYPYVPHVLAQHFTDYSHPLFTPERPLALEEIRSLRAMLTPHLHLPTAILEVSFCVINDDALFAHLIKDMGSLQLFTRSFPTHAIAAVERTCKNKADFDRIIPDEASLQTFMKCFPLHGERAEKLFAEKNEGVAEQKAEPIPKSVSAQNAAALSPARGPEQKKEGFLRSCSQAWASMFSEAKKSSRSSANSNKLVLETTPLLLPATTVCREEEAKTILFLSSVKGKSSSPVIPPFRREQLQTLSSSTHPVEVSSLNVATSSAISFFPTSPLPTLPLDPANNASTSETISTSSQNTLAFGK